MAPFKVIYLLLGLVMVLGSIYYFFKLSGKDGSEEVSLQGRSEFALFINLLVLILGVILLRQAYVMYTGISRSVVF